MSLRRCILSTAAALSLSAQEPSVDDLKELQTILDQPVEAAGKRVQRLKEAAADMTVLQGHDLRDLGYRTLGDALGGVLGFRTNEDRSYQGLGVRGLYVLGDQNTRVLILLDGHALNNAAEVGSSKVGTDFGIPLSQIERIEIVRGPASSLYGNNAFLGMVNVVTRGGREPLGGELAGSGDTRSLAQGDAMLNGTLGTAGWRLLCSEMDRGGSSTRFPELSAQGLPASLDQEKHRSAYLTLRGQEWSLAGYLMEREQHTSTAPFHSTLASPLNRIRNRQGFFEGRYTPTLGPVETLFRIFGDRTEYGCDLDYDGTRGTHPGVYTESDPNWSLGAEGQARIKLGEQLLLSLGCEGSQQHFDGSAHSNSIQIETRVRYRLQNTYLQGEWRPTESLGLTLGIQDAAWIVGRAETLIDGTPVLHPTQTRRGFTPRVAAVWQPSPLDILKLLYGTGYRNPTIFERYYSDDGSILANPSLEPERIRTLSGVWVHVWGGGIQSQVSLNQSRWDHLIQPVVIVEGTQQSQNDPRPLQGCSLETELQGRWSGWSLYGSLGLYRWTQGGEIFPDSARVQGGLRLVRHWRHLNASGEIRYLGPRENRATSARVPGSTVGRMSLGWEGERWWLQGTLEDAGNARRQDLVATDYDPITRMPSDGRTLRLSAGWRF